jgi:hypothetical protein
MATRKRILRLGAIAALGLLGALLLWAAMAPEHPVNARALRQIQPGMTHDEVERILGPDHGGLRADRVWIGGNIDPWPGCRGATWFGDDLVIQVWFGDDDGLVRGTEYRELLPVQRGSYFGELRRWLGL